MVGESYDEYKRKMDQANEPKDPDALTIAEMDGKTYRPANKILTRIHLIDKAGKVYSMQYHHLDSHSIFDGGCITLLFVGPKHWEVKVKVHGKKNWQPYDYITLHRWPYIREESGSMPGAGKQDDEVYFTDLQIKDVTPRPEAG